MTRVGCGGTTTNDFRWSYSDVGGNMSLVGCGGIWVFWISYFFNLKIEWGEVLCTVFG